MSEGIKLTEIRKSDSDTLFRWINDPTLVVFNANYRPLHFATHEEWIEKVVKNKDVSIFAIRLVDTEELIGTCQLHSIDHLSHTAELQIRIGNSNYQNRGYGSEAVNQLVSFGFKSLNLNKIYLHVFEDNTRAIKTYMNCGFEQEGLLKRHTYVDGNYKNLLIMSKFRN